MSRTANARNQARQQDNKEQQVRYDQQDEPEPFQPRAWVVNPLDWITKRAP